MRCPYCSDPTNRVIDSRLGRDGTEIRRRRECAECGRRFTTRERVDEVLPKIVKRDERREEFHRGKLLIAVQKACEKRPISIDTLEDITARIEDELHGQFERDVAAQIAAMPMPFDGKAEAVMLSGGALQSARGREARRVSSRGEHDGAVEAQ